MLYDIKITFAQAVKLGAWVDAPDMPAEVLLRKDGDVLIVNQGDEYAAWDLNGHDTAVHEATTDALNSSLESGVPITNTAYARGELAPENLLGVEYLCYTADSEEGDGEQPRKFFLWVGLDSEHGAPNIDAGRERLEDQGWQVTEWAAA